MIRLAAFDIDRTLIPPETGTLVAETLMALQELKKRGIAIAIASGRQLQHLPSVLLEVGFDYYILSNGACIADHEGNVIHHEAINTDTVRQLAEDVLRRDLPMEIRYTRGFFSVNPSQRFEDYLGLEISEDIRAELMAPKPITPGPEDVPIACVAVILPEEHAWFERKYPQMDFLSIFGTPLCDINKSGVSKASGLKSICERMGISLAETIAFGDDRNDLEMIRSAGIGVAMGEAIDSVKSAADYVTDFSRNLGVVKGLRHFQLID